MKAFTFTHLRRAFANKQLTQLGKKYSTKSLQKICELNDRDIGGARHFKGLILGVYEKNTLTDTPKITPAGQLFDQKVDGKLSKLIQEMNISGKIGSGKVLHDIDTDFDAIAVVGLGRKDIGFNEIECINQNMENVRIATAIGAKILRKQNCTQICVDGMDFPEQAAEGTALTMWKFQANLCEEKKVENTSIKLYGPSDVNAWMRGIFRAEAQNIARNLCELPSNQLTPAELGQKAVDLLCPCGVTVEVRDEEWIHAQKMDATIAVACTSCEQPIFLEINYRGGNADDKPIMLVGKGITFNTGGLSLKRSDALYEMRASMAGAAITIATVRAAAQLQIPLNIVALIPICEHMTSGMAVRPSDILRFPNGKTVAVDSSSNAGILTIADALLYGQCNYKPKLIVNIGSLANDIRYAFDESVTPVFTNSHNLWCEIQESGSYSGDRVWQMPLWNYHNDRITNSTSADATNVGNGNGRCGKVAAFLKSFVPNFEFVHLDVHGVGMLNPNDTAFPYLEEKRMSGRPTRTIIQFLVQLSSIKVDQQRF